MYVYCIYPAMSKSPKITTKLSNESRNECRSNCFLMLSSVTSALILLSFLTVAQHESGIRKAISWSMTVYSLYFLHITSILFLG